MHVYILKMISPFEDLSCKFGHFGGDVLDMHTCPLRRQGSCAKQSFTDFRGVSILYILYIDISYIFVYEEVSYESK